MNEKQLNAKTEKIYLTFRSLYGCCGTPLCRSELKEAKEKIKALKDVDISEIKELGYKYSETIKFIIRETLRLSK